MNQNSRRTALSCAGLLLSLSGGSLPVAAGATAPQLEEIIVTAVETTADASLMAPDAASLLATPGDVNDPLKALLALPGITFGGGDLDAPVVRGSGPADNLFLIDGIPVENLFHELSDSIVSPNVIRTFDLHAAAFAPRYGNVTGGVIDIGLRDPSASERHLKLDLGQLKSGLLLETPVTDSVAVYGSYRRNLAHLFLEEFERGNDALVFRMPRSDDYSGRLIWRGNHTALTLTALGAWDRTEEVARESNLSAVLGEEETRQLDARAVGFRSQLSEHTELAVTLSHSDIDTHRRQVNGSFIRRQAQVLALRSELSHTAGRHQLAAGVNLARGDNRLDFRGSVPLCDRLEQNCGGVFAAVPARFDATLRNTELYAGDRIAISDRLHLGLGLHAAEDHFLDQRFIEPRADVFYRATHQWELYARAGQHHVAPQPQELLILNLLADRQQSERSTQALIGQRWDRADGWRLQTEIWFKDFERTELIGTGLQRAFEGETYGLDILLARPIGSRFYGWAALSFSDGSVSDRSRGLEVDNRFAPPVSATVAATYAFDHGWKLGAKYRFQSGDPFTPLAGMTADPDTGAPLPLFGEPFSERLGDYSRLDIRVEKTSQYGFGEVLYYVDILNVVDRENAARRRYPLRGAGTVLADDEEGIPFFVAVGINFSFQGL
ncbi:hypothetical protein FKG94_03770 [Exilibacterium tricleocarpae]|uniref:TonB-dependent receptor n=1 Tax=Exilibacterium tricleocarpae TaxID=2591008 RepID=A0A545U5A7_9GAMM|nr:TonB-dependent receptor [Exilibacterium tricleocarpae]TQV84650.1 hypothetical protein FKG94_03770 [Exilibacterium tricleocarpae]